MATSEALHQNEMKLLENKWLRSPEFLHQLREDIILPRLENLCELDSAISGQDIGEVVDAGTLQRSCSGAPRY